MDYKQKISEAVLGLALADSIGVPLEFVEPNLLKEHPVTGMLEHGSHDVPLGTWSDDTSMSLCLIDALNHSIYEVNYKLIMDNFSLWITNAVFTATDEVFDVGRTCFNAIKNYLMGDLKTEECGLKGPYDCGNGGLMRILPLLFWLNKFYGKDFINNKEALKTIYDVTSLTHGHEKCLMANVYYLSIANEILHGSKKIDAMHNGILKADKVLKAESRFDDYFHSFRMIHSDLIYDPNNPDITAKMYVVDTLNTSLWSFITTNSYKECILKAVNLGLDADTTAAIAGGLAGMYYGIGGEKGIPLEWLGNLKKLEYIGNLCDMYAQELEKIN